LIQTEIEFDMIEGEKTIREEAKQFYEWKIAQSSNNQAIEDFHAIKRRLHDFYSPESKAIFLDEIQTLITSNMQ